MSLIPSSFDFAGSTAFVTGGASGIGRACAMALAECGASVAVADTDVAGGLRAVREIEAAGGAALFEPCDVTDETQIAAAVEACINRFGPLHHSVNCAGVVERQSLPIAELELDEFERVLAVNLRGVFLCMRHELRAMTRTGSGSIVNIASGAGLVGVRVAPAYNASKHGVIGLTKSAALDYALAGIRVNAVCPGVVETPLLSQVDPEAMAGVREAHPVGRIGTVEEIAASVLWLCSAGASFTTGVALPVDGGYVVA